MAAFFQSLKNIKMYAGNGGIAAQLVLEQRVFDTFYPQGIVSVRALVTCVAYRLDMSIAELGRQLRVPNFKEKLNSESRHRLQPDEIVKLRDYLAPQLKYMSHLGINMGLLDQLLPGPSEITQQSEAGFAQQLNDWARYATGTDIRSFAEQVSRYSGKSYVPQAVYQWGHGVGLAAALPFIVQALENNPHTRDDFLICRDRFIAAAEREIAPKSGLNISEKNPPCPYPWSGVGGSRNIWRNPASSSADFGADARPLWGDLFAWRLCRVEGRSSAVG